MHCCNRLMQSGPPRPTFFGLGQYGSKPYNESEIWSRTERRIKWVYRFTSHRVGSSYSSYLPSLSRTRDFRVTADAKLVEIPPNKYWHYVTMYGIRAYLQPSKSMLLLTASELKLKISVKMSNNLKNLQLEGQNHYTATSARSNLPCLYYL